MTFEILFPFGLWVYTWVFEPDWLLDHSQLVSRRPCVSEMKVGAVRMSTLCFLSNLPIFHGPPQGPFPRVEPLDQNPQNPNRFIVWNNP